MPPSSAASAPQDEPAELREKSAGAFRTISEVAQELEVPQHVLRFWETRFGQIRPMKRAGGRRYYRPDDVDLVAGIKHLLHVRRYTIKGVQRIIKEHGVRFVQAVGRGEAVASPPLLQDLDGGQEAGVDALAPYDPATAPLPATDQAALEDALHEMRACRVLLDAVRLPPE
ncbi:MAG: MerR family transcriptional regulator [Parafilimonas terrae]|jgi:DNA-binding transcriptional MerR regulator|nr:MerR family transcriptional regulator [Parafilimonas terrae]